MARKLLQWQQKLGLDLHLLHAWPVLDPRAAQPQLTLLGKGGFGMPACTKLFYNALKLHFKFNLKENVCPKLEKSFFLEEDGTRWHLACSAQSNNKKDDDQSGWMNNRKNKLF